MWQTSASKDFVSPVPVDHLSTSFTAVELERTPTLSDTQLCDNFDKTVLNGARPRGRLL